MCPQAALHAEQQRPARAEPSRPGLAGTLRRELARTPIIGRLLQLLREPAAPAAPLVLALPEALLASVFSSGGLPSTLAVSLSCRTAHTQLWQSPFFWRGLLLALGAPDAELRAAAPEGAPWLAAAKALRGLARRRLLGVDLLVGRGAQCCLSLEDARKAVMAVQVEDGAALIQCAAASLASMLRDASEEEEPSRAEALLEAVAARPEIFTTAQMLDILGAHQEAAPEPPDLGAAPKPPRRQALAAPGSPQRPSRKERRQARASAAAAA